MKTVTEIVNCNGLPNGVRAYGGHDGPKRSVIYKGALWLLKYPKRLAFEYFYSTSPLSEYIGSHIYRILGYNVHETILGVEGHRCVVLCKDFRPKNEEYYDFSQMLSLSLGMEVDRQMMEEAGGITGPNRKGLNLKRIVFTLDNNPYLPKGSKERFWDMFVIDGLIGNANRHNEDWGFLGDLAHLQLSPVFDNGSSFLPLASDVEIEQILQDDNTFSKLICKGDTPYWVRNKKVDWFSAIKNADLPFGEINTVPLRKAIERNVPIMQSKLPEIFQMIDNIPEYTISNGKRVSIMTNARKEVYKRLLSIRLKEALNG